jgi:hypothetical protein
MNKTTSTINIFSDKNVDCLKREIHAIQKTIVQLTFIFPCSGNTDSAVFAAAAVGSSRTTFSQPQRVCPTDRKRNKFPVSNNFVCQRPILTFRMIKSDSVAAAKYTVFCSCSQLSIAPAAAKEWF